MPGLGSLGCPNSAMLPVTNDLIHRNNETPNARASIFGMS